MATPLQDLLGTTPKFAPIARRSALGLAAGLAIVLTGCSGGGGSSGGTGLQQPNSGNADLVSMAFGRLVDVYGLRRIDADTTTVELVETDVVIGLDIQDERGPTDNLRDSDILYDFIGSNPDNLQPRLLITREIGSPEFQAGFTALRAKLRQIAPALFGQNVAQRPFTVVPRNAVIELQFSESLGVTEEFFVVKDENGNITGVRNTEAVQLLEIVGDPKDADHRGDFKVVPTRVIPRGATLIVDPVLLGSEGARYGVRNNASGMPQSPDQLGANMRLALALQGPLRIPGLRERTEAFVGHNNAGMEAIVRDFRSGNENDNSADIARGFVRDAEPPRLIGEILFFLERVDPDSDATQVITLYKNGRNHDIDRGDIVRIIDPATQEPFAVTEVVEDPEDDRFKPEEQHVRVVVRAVPGLPALDPRRLPGYPADLKQREAFLRRHAPRAVLVTEFTGLRDNPLTGQPYSDDPVNFLAFSPTPRALANGDPSPANENISPFAEAIIRFTKPVDLDTVRAFDSFFFAKRNVIDRTVIEETFLRPRSLDPAAFNYDKFATPHLVSARIIDEDGSQTSIRLQPLRGFFLNEEMRLIDEPLPFEDKQFRYFMHLLGGNQGVRDLAGNPIDFQSSQGVQDFLVIPFSLDTRKDASGTPYYADNLVVSVVRRFADKDEDEQPSLYLDGEVAKIDPTTGAPIDPPAEAWPLEDLFGAVVYLSNGKLQARPTARVTKIVDDLNQAPPPPQDSNLRHCPKDISNQPMVASNSAGVRFGAGIQNPLNPFGCRLQTLWREIDMSLSRVDPFDFDLDVEQMYWAPFTNGAITYDEFDQVSLYLGHSELRPEPCVGATSALPELPNSGLGTSFEDNYAHNLDTSRTKSLNPPKHPAYEDQRLVIDASLAFTEPNGINRYLPLPEFQKPYFVWRDQTSELQGGDSGKGSDIKNGNDVMPPYIISPFLGGQGRFVTGTPGNLQFNFGMWENVTEYSLATRSTSEHVTDGHLGAIALPLLADFWTYCDDPDKPAGNGFIATGFNGWQIALAVQSAPQPNFRAYSGGFAGTASRPSVCIDTSDPDWQRATGGYQPDGSKTPRAVDNSVYWIMADFLKRQSVVVAGFVDIFNPHRMPARSFAEGDPRLGPYLVDANGNSSLPPGVLPSYDWAFEPPLDTLPGGTRVIPEFRAAGPVDPEPWRAQQRTFPESPNEINFPLDPLKAGDAHMDKYDDRVVNGQPRNWWTGYYNRNVTEYTRDISQLSDDRWTNRFSGPSESFNAAEVRYFNWRFIMQNNVDATPPIAPTIESFAVTYRFERR